MSGTLDRAMKFFADELDQYGKMGLSVRYPRDFEYYMCALELVDENDDTVDYFMFPVMPSSISKTETEATSIQTSFAGITIFNKQGFTPDELNIQGDFGRALKLLSWEEDGYYKGIGLTIEDGYYTSDQVNSNFQDIKRGFMSGVKTGFGCIKILQSIIHKAKAHSQTGITYKLYFDNLAMGESYLVVPTKAPLVFSQDVQSSNMIWRYQLSLLIIADLKDVLAEQTKKKSMKSDLSQNSIVSGISDKSPSNDYVYPILEQLLEKYFKR